MTPSLHVCSGCQSVYYCSIEHQIADRKRHKSKCFLVQEQFVSPGSSFGTFDVGFNQPNVGPPLPREKIQAKRRITQPATSSCQTFAPLPPPIPALSDFDVDAILEEAIGPFLDSTDFKCNMFPDPGTLISPVNLDLVENPSLGQEGFTQQLSNISLNGDMTKFDYDTVEDVSNIVVDDMTEYGICVVDDFLGEQQGCAVLNEVLNIYNSGIFKDGQLVNSKGNNRLVPRYKYF